MVYGLEEVAKKVFAHKANRNIAAKIIQKRSLKPDPSIADEVEKFLTKRPEATPEWNVQTGGVLSITGDLAEPILGTATEVTQRFLAENFKVFGVKENLEDLVEVDRFSLAYLETVKYQQTYENYPIFGAEMLVSIDPQNRVRIVAADNLIKPEKQAKVPEPTSRTEAKQVALEDLGEDTRQRGVIQSDVVWYPSRKDYALTYHFLMPMETPFGDWDYFIDASTGDILDSYNSLRFSVFGPRGKVYMENPDESVVTDTVILKNLKCPYKYLNGTYCKVLNEDAPEAVASSAWAFYYPDNTTHFDEVQLYYAMERTYQYFLRLGFRGFLSKNRNKVLTGTVHQGTNYNNAYYSPATGQIYFGDGSGPPGGLNDLSKEVDVVAHEFTHALIDEIRPGISGVDAGGLHEGTADYFACSITNDHFLGEYVLPGPGGIRDIKNDKKYPNAPNQPHMRGLVWGGACWELRDALNEHLKYGELGIQIADFLIFASIHLITTPFPTYKYVKDKILLVDQVLCGGEYKSMIKEIFETKRGIPV